MKITLAIVTSADGKSTKGDVPPGYWASDADQEYFGDLLKEHNLLIFGRNTYLVVKDKMKLSPEKLRVVMTSKKDDFKNDEVKGQLEFSDESPIDLVTRLEKKGFEKALLLSGEKLNTAFFKEGLVDELWLTVEPKIFGSGKKIVIEEALDIPLMLDDHKKLSDQGTLLLKYKVIKDESNSD